MSAIAILLALFAQLGQLQLPGPVGYVNDFARVIGAADSARMASIIEDVRRKSGGEIVVVTLADLKGREAADVARELGRQWKVGATGAAGDRARNAGVIILLVPKETSSDGRGHSFISPGQGAEGYLTDATVGAMQDEALPLLQQRDYGSALTLMTTRVAQRFAREFNFALDSSVAVRMPRQPVSGGGGIGSLRIPPFVYLILFFIVLSMLRGGRRRRGCGGGCLPIFLPMGGGWGGGGGGWSSGGGGGGFGGFGGFGGGGGFSGGGSGRSW